MPEVVVGRIGRPHGVRGEVTIEVRTDEPDRRFATGAVLRAEDGGARFTVSSRSWHQGRLLVRFDEIADRTAAEQARGTVLVLDVADDESPEEPDSYYDRQLVGLRVLTDDGAEAGRITEVVHLPGQDLLSVDTGAGSRLVPFVSALVPEVDLAAGTVRLADRPGLLDALD